MSDLISRADAMAYPISWENYDKSHGDTKFVCGVESYREYIEYLPSAQPKQEWILVSEKLPDIEQDVLATTTLFGTREVTFAWRINDSEWLIREGSSEATNNDILAWMPLPEPYKEGQGEDNN